MYKYKNKALFCIIIYFLFSVNLIASASEKQKKDIISELKNYKNAVNAIDLTDYKSIEKGFFKARSKAITYLALKAINKGCGKEEIFMCSTEKDIDIGLNDLDGDGIPELFVKSLACGGRGCPVFIVKQSDASIIGDFLDQGEPILILKENYDGYHSIMTFGREWDCADYPYNGFTLYRWNKNNKYYNPNILFNQYKLEKPQCN